MKKTDVAALALVIVGALNWGLVAIASFDLVAAVFGLGFGETNAATRIVYGLVGLAGVWLAVRAKALVTTPQPAMATANVTRDRVTA
jgi:uncharacterized membrane protein YuzA (DUF378 family)